MQTIDKSASEMIKSADKLKKKISKLTVAMKRHQIVPGQMIVPVTAQNIADKMKLQHKLEFKPEQFLLAIPLATFVRLLPPDDPPLCFAFLPATAPTVSSWI